MVVLARALGESSVPVEVALKAYEAARLERTARIHIGSRGITWLKGAENADWVYGYDACSAAL